MKASAYPYITREEMRELDRLAIEQYQIPGIILMENAGAGAAREIHRQISCGPVAIFCGRGNNGGDGFVIARHLLNHGIAVDLFFVGDLAKVAPKSDPGINLTILKQMGIVPTIISAGQDLAGYRNDSLKLVVDALLGTGLSGEVKEPLAGVMREIVAWNKPVVAIDIPSGLDANTGEILGTAIPAVKTVTFALPKKGFICGQGPQITGDVVVVEISIPRDLLRTKWPEID